MIHSMLLIGQSNMAGRGFVKEAVPVDGTHVKVLRNGRWQPFYRPINNDRSFSGVCLGESFAEAYAKTYGVEAGIIPCADGGTRLDQWMPGEILFENAVNCTRLAQRTSTVAAILWHQGESDCGDPVLRATYRARFETMISSLRDACDLHDVPVLLGGLGDFLPIHNEAWYGHGNAAALNEILRQMAEETPLTGFVSAEGLTANPDNLHFNAPSLHAFGMRYYKAYEANKDGNKVFPIDDTALRDLPRTALEKL